MREKLYYLGFSLFPGVGPVLFDKLLQRFGSAEKAWNSSSSNLREVLGEKLGEEFVNFRKTVELEKEYKKCIQKDIQLVIWKDKKYPERLKQLMTDKPTSGVSLVSRVPFLLYAKGNISLLSSPKTIGIVGTRKITPYGKQVTEMLTGDLVTQGFVTVSGLALGVDGVAHTTTIQNNGKTIAVLGCGVDCCYPRENKKIYDTILISGGAIVSTFPPGMQASRGSFPARNAIIAGLSLGVVVTEGAADSGSLITASYAKKFGRPIFAVPGPITSNLSRGSNSLIKDGAIMVSTSKDILDSLGIMGALKVDDRRLKVDKGNKEEQEIFVLLESGPLHFDEIVRRIKKDSKTIGSLLSLMELKGMIKNNSEGKYSI